MVSQRICEYGKEKGLHARTLDRWLKLPENDQEALMGLAQKLKIGENHLRDFLDWIEEIILRDGSVDGGILKKQSIIQIESDPRLSRNDKLKRIKDELRRLRFPRLVHVEGEIQKRIRGLGIPTQMQMSVPPNLEGGTLSVQIKSASHEELRRLVRELGLLVDRNEMTEIFALLTGSDGDAVL
jgi:hypothetical protein